MHIFESYAKKKLFVYRNNSYSDEQNIEYADCLPFNHVCETFLENGRGFLIRVMLVNFAVWEGFSQGGCRIIWEENKANITLEVGEEVKKREKKFLEMMYRFRCTVWQRYAGDNCGCCRHLNLY